MTMDSKSCRENSGQKSEGSVFKTIKRILVYLKPQRIKIIFIFFILIGETILKILSPWIMGEIVNVCVDISKHNISLESMQNKLLWFTVLLVISFIGTWICSTGVSYIMSLIGNNTLYELRKDIFCKTQMLSLKTFQKYKSGEIMSRIMNNTSSICNVFNTLITNFLRNIFFLTGILVTMLLLNPRLTAVIVIIPVLMAVTTIYFSKNIRNAHRKIVETVSDINSELVEDIAGVKVTQSFNRQKENISNFNKVNRNNMNASRNVASLYALIYPVYNVINNIGFALVLAYGGYLYIHGMVSIGVIFTFIQYIEKFFYPIKSLSSLWYDIQAGVAAGEHVFEFIDCSETLSEDEESITLNKINGMVEFRNVDFEYISGKPVLKSVSFTALSGQKTAIVGPTGSGKTTILNLISRFYDVKSGQVLIDGHDIRKISRDSLKNKIGVVLQDTYLFSESIMENIRYGCPEASNREVIEASQKAYAHEFIKDLPDGYNTVISEDGGNLSRGQRQLLSIARVILSDPRILILDEATSSVDTKTEILIQKAIENLLNGRTSFIVAHRLSTIRNADLILVVKDGSIVERGSREELLV